MTHTTLADRIAASHVTQRRVARLCGIHQSTLTRILAGTRRASPDLLQEIAAALEALEEADHDAHAARQYVLRDVRGYDRERRAYEYELAGREVPS